MRWLDEIRIRHFNNLQICHCPSNRIVTPSLTDLTTILNNINKVLLGYLTYPVVKRSNIWHFHEFSKGPPYYFQKKTLAIFMMEPLTDNPFHMPLYHMYRVSCGQNCCTGNHANTVTRSMLGHDQLWTILCPSNGNGYHEMPFYSKAISVP